MLQKSGHWDRMLLDCTENLCIYDNEISSALNLLLEMVLRRYIYGYTDGGRCFMKGHSKTEVDFKVFFFH